MKTVQEVISDLEHHAAPRDLTQSEGEFRGSKGKGREIMLRVDGTDRYVPLTLGLAQAIVRDSFKDALAGAGVGALPLPTQPTFNPEVSGTAGDGQTRWQQEFAAGEYHYRLELGAQRFIRATAHGFGSLEILAADGFSFNFRGATPMAVSQLLEPGIYFVKATTSTTVSTSIQITVATPTSLPTPAVSLMGGEVAAWYVPQFTSGGGALVLSGQTEAAVTLGNPARNAEIPLDPGSSKTLPWTQPVDLLITLTGPGTEVSVQNVLPR